MLWRATHRGTGQVAAVKILHHELAAQPELVLRFEREAEAASRLQHPNIAEVYERGRLRDGRPYFVMEYVDGIDLDSYLTARGTLSPQEVVPILEQLSSALETTHAHGIVHRDLKASNVLLGRRDGSLRVVLLDFGVAKLLEDSSPRLTGSRAMIGTPSCMAPEQIRCEAVSAQTDVYALGSLTYHMLTGQQPFWNENLIVTLYLHLNTPAPPPSSAGGVAPVFDEVVTRAMNKERAARYSSVSAFIAALRAAHDEAHGTTRASQPAMQPSPALGLYIHVYAEPGCLDNPDDEMLDDMESILPEVEHYLTSRGYLLAHDNGNSALYVQPMPERPVDELTRRRQAISTAVALRGEIAARPNRDDRVLVSIYLHVADARLDGDAVRGGALLDLAEWVPGSNGEGIFGSSAVMHRLDTPSDPVTRDPIRFYRITTGN